MNKNLIVVVLVFLVALSVLMIFAFGSTQSVAPAAPSSGDYGVTLTTNPNTPSVSDVTLIVEVRDRSGRAVNDADVKVSATHPSMSHAGISDNATAQGTGRYAIKGNMGMSGTWRAKVEINRPGAPPFAQEFAVAVK